ncbi:MAG: exodeoxyribonuclease VII small subunit [Parcubacteria group bacterium SW_4_49_11]|nr:MAG: exodeoxyribonuclease VII small subunit [Parcubacteria group bacterium SW_4_49_11]
MTEKDTPTFQEAFEELEKLTKEFEQGEVGLEEGIKKFERGVYLSNLCKSRLQEVENRIKEVKHTFDAEDETNIQ